jgi:TetR/AcrR family transcriptional regulator
VPHIDATRRAPAKPAARTRTYVPSAERRLQILDAAADLFATSGFAGTTTREIAKAAGTSETVLFRHFPTKERLYADILERRIPSAEVERWLDGLRAIAAKRNDEALFTAVVTAVVESYRRDPVHHRLMLFAALEDRALARIAQVKYAEGLSEFLRDYVTRRQAEGALKRMRPELVVHMLLSVAGHFAQWSALGVNPLGLSDREVASLAATLLVGLRAEPERGQRTPVHLNHRSSQDVRNP